MAKAGRKSKSGVREPNGRIKRPTTQAALNEAADRSRRKEQSTVLMQPHRGGRVPSTSLVRTVSRKIGADGKVVETVLDADHDRFVGIEGDPSPEAESPLGRLCLRLKLRSEIFKAGLQYGSIVACWRSAKGVPMQTDCGPGGSGEGPSEATVNRWQTRMVDIERAVVRDGGVEALLTLRTIVLDVLDAGVERDEIGALALKAVAVELGLMREHPEPFAG